METCLAGCRPFGDVPAAVEQGAKQCTENPVVPRAGTHLCSGAGPSGGKPGCIFSEGAEVTLFKPNPPVAAACAMGAMTGGRGTVSVVPWGHTDSTPCSPPPVSPVSPAALSSPGQGAEPQPGGFISCAQGGPSAPCWRPPWPAAPSLWPGQAGFSVRGWGHQVTGTPSAPFSWEQVS